ncbi:MAG: DUF3972 domain-containing protein [Alphaproteobacteria bacterium]|nr:DUF3972 domain-containing protein [Alphaproteobacteria bacterium]
MYGFYGIIHNKERNNKKERRNDMEKDKHIEENFVDMLAMLKKKIREKDEEVERLRNENTKLKEKLSEIAPDLVLEETFKRR